MPGPPVLDGGDGAGTTPAMNPALVAAITLLMIWTVGWFIWDDLE